MIVLKRKPEQRIQIGDDIMLTITETARGYCCIGIDAPGMPIQRRDAEPRLTPRKETNRGKGQEEEKRP